MAFAPGQGGPARVGGPETRRDRGRPDRRPALRAFGRGLGGRNAADRAIERLRRSPSRPPPSRGGPGSRRWWGSTGIGDFARAEPCVLAERGGGSREAGTAALRRPRGGLDQKSELAVASGTGRPRTRGAAGGDRGRRRRGAWSALCVTVTSRFDAKRSTDTPAGPCAHHAE